MDTDPRASTDPAVTDTVAKAQRDQAAATSPSPADPAAAHASVASVDPAVHAAVADAQRQAAGPASVTDPRTLGQLIDARDDFRGKYNAVKGLPQYATEEAFFKAQLDALEQRIAGRA